jgi:hypothetical protein
MRGRSVRILGQGVQPRSGRSPRRAAPASQPQQTEESTAVAVPVPRRPAAMADVVAGERRSWLSTASGALAVSALGLALAGSVTSTGPASTGSAES